MSPARPARPSGTLLGVGLCVLDELLVVEQFEARAERQRYRARHVAAGGMVANALCQAAALGVRTHLASAVGDDPEGRRLRAELRAAGVGTRRMQLSDRLPTTVAVVLVRERDGERRFWVPDRRHLEGRAPGFDLRGINRRSVLLIDGHFPREARAAVRAARAAGATVVADFNRPDAAALDLLPFVDVPIVPEEFARAYTRGGAERAVRRLQGEFGGRPVVTLGARGGVYAADDGPARWSAERVRVRDTTGAGDAFHGAFCAGLLHGLPFERAIALGARAAARVCTAFGARGRLMSAAEFARFPGVRARRPAG